MMNWLYYLLEANLHLVLFYGFYRLFLHKETFYAINRYYLIFTSLTAFVLPFFQLGFLKNTAPIDINYIVFPKTNQINIKIPENLAIGAETFFNISNISIIIYLSITSLFLLRFVISFISLIKLCKNNYTVLENGISLISLKESKRAFSFFNLLFIDPQLAEQNTILKHELVHIKQKHSIDVIYFEILHAVNWFNPIVYLIKNDIRLIHEYIADEETTKNGIEKYDYSLFLIRNSSGIQNLTLTNQIFSSSTLKKRISMLNQKKSANWARLKLLLVLPIIAGMLCISTMAFTKNYGFVNIYDGLKKATIKQDTVKTPFETNDGISVPNINTLYMAYHYDKTLDKPMPYSKKLIVVNGKKTAPGEIGGLKEINLLITLDRENGIKKYGELGKHGVIEAQGANIEILTTPPPPPPADPNMKPKVITLPPPPPILPKEYPTSTTIVNLYLKRSRGDKLSITNAQSNDKKTLLIFNPSGEKIYEKIDYQDDWDGNVQNTTQSKTKLAAGNYSYIVLFTNKKGMETSKIKGELIIE